MCELTECSTNGGVYWLTQSEPSGQPHRSTTVTGYFDVPYGPDDWITMNLEPIEYGSRCIPSEHHRMLANEFMNGVRDGIPSFRYKSAIQAIGGFELLSTRLAHVFCDVTRNAFLHAFNFNPAVFEGLFINVSVCADGTPPQRFDFIWTDEPFELFQGSLADKVNVGNGYALIPRTTRMQLSDPNHISGQFAPLESLSQARHEVAHNGLVNA